MRIQPDQMKCKHCQHSEFAKDAPVLWCETSKLTGEPCMDLSREPEQRVTNDTANPTTPVVRLCPGRRRNAKAFAKVPIGSLVTREWRKVRNSKHHRMRFAWVPEIFAAIEHLGLFGKRRMLRAHLTLQTEFVHVIVNLATGK